jgi:hypothetical protein
VTHPRRGDGDRSGDGVRWAGRSAKGGGEAFGGGEVVVGERGEAIAAAICRPVAMPPAASTGTSRIGRIASTASGTSTNVVTSIDVFGELGWAGFTIEAVARRSRVGKAAIYLRWPSKAELLVAALRDRIGPITATDTDSVPVTTSSASAVRSCGSTWVTAAAPCCVSASRAIVIPTSTRSTGSCAMPRPGPLAPSCVAVSSAVIYRRIPRSPWSSMSCVGAR